MRTQVISSSDAPAAVGPYSQAIRLGDLLYTSGQIALDPATGELVGRGTDDVITRQTQQVFANLEAVLSAAGSSLDQVVKTTVFLRYMKDFAEMNATYATYFGEHPPARSTIAVSALPLGALVEIEAVATIIGETEKNVTEQAAAAAAPAVAPKKEKKKRKSKKDKKKKKKKK